MNRLTLGRKESCAKGGFRRVAMLLSIVALFAPGCARKAADQQRTVTLYTSVDEPFVRPIIEQFERRTGIHVNLLTDAEASKSVGLAERIRAEKDHPNADVWWDNECFLTINLAEEGILAAYNSPASADIPARFKDPQHRWAGSVIRVRMLIASKKKSDIGFAPPVRLTDLLRPEFKGKIAIARPTAGTTGAHVAALYTLWGRDRAREFFRGLRANQALLLGGNSVVAESVAQGELRAGLCDNDDAAAARTEIGPLEACLPDQGPNEEGTLAMPCAVSLVAGAPHSAAARELIDYLLSRQTDEQLLATSFAWCSARNVVGKGKWMEVDYRAVAANMPAAIREATQILEGRN